MSVLEDFARSQRFVLSDASSIPLYYQLFRLLERFISEKHLEEGDRFPSEEAIAEAFDVSRPTANHATRELLARGWLRRERGRGTFIGRGSHVEFALLSDELSFSSQFRNGSRLMSRLVHCRYDRASVPVAEALELPAGASVIDLRRLRFVDDRPALVSDVLLPAERFPDFDGQHLSEGSLFSTLRKRYHVSIARSERWIEASETFSQDVADLLGIPPLTPILLVRGLAYTAEDEPIAHLTAYVREGISFQMTAYTHESEEQRSPRTFFETVEGGTA